MEEFLVFDSALDLKGNKEDFLNPLLSLSFSNKQCRALAVKPQAEFDTLQCPQALTILQTSSRLCRLKMKCLHGRGSGDEGTEQV